MSLSCRLTVSYCHQWGNTKASRGGQVAYSEDTLVEGETWRWVLQGEYCHVSTLHCAAPLCNTTNTMPFVLQDDTSKTSSTANELGLANVGGVFVVLMGGMGVACVIAVCEFVWKSRKVAVEERVRNILQDT